MRLLVTGGAGFIGSAVVRTAIANGHEVLNLDALTYASNLENVAQVSNTPAYQFVKADIRDRPALSGIFIDFRPDAVIHLAAESHVDRSIDGPTVFAETNVLGTVNLLEAATAYWSATGRSENFRFVHVSTDEVFGSLGKMGTFDETTPYSPRSPYAASKAASDHFVRAWQETYGLPTLLTNCSNNYGPFHHPEKLIPSVILKAYLSLPISVYGTGDNVRDWLHVDDHARALLLVLTDGKVGETYAIGGHGECSNIDLVRQICSEMDRILPDRAPHDALIEFVEDRPGHDLRYAIDSSKISRDLEWAPEINLADGIVKTIRWYLDNHDWWAPHVENGAINARLGVSLPNDTRNGADE